MLKRTIFINVFWTVLQLERSISSLNALIFSGDNKCRQAMIHGMCIAAMLMSDCDQMLVESEEILYESGTV